MAFYPTGISSFHPPPMSWLGKSTGLISPLLRALHNDCLRKAHRHTNETTHSKHSHDEKTQKSLHCCTYGNLATGVPCSHTSLLTTEEGHTTRAPFVVLLFPPTGTNRPASPLRSTTPGFIAPTNPSVRRRRATVALAAAAAVRCDRARASRR